MIKFKDDLHDLEVPEKILVLDESYPEYYNKVLELYLGSPWHGSDETVFYIVGEGYDKWLYPEEMANLKYVDYEKVKNLKIFL